MGKQLISIFVMFCSVDVHERIKRESGANPGQTRCCKLHQSLYENATVNIWEGHANEVSQKTCKAMFHKAFEEIKLKKNLFKNFYLLFLIECYLLIK